MLLYCTVQLCTVRTFLRGKQILEIPKEGWGLKHPPRKRNGPYNILAPVLFEHVSFDTYEVSSYTRRMSVCDVCIGVVLSSC
jgi:hypothetical protein